jgi:hypothetical protein
MGRLMLIHRQQGMASNYDCCICGCPLSYMPGLGYVSPATSNLLVQGTVGLILYGGYWNCNDDPFYYDVNGSATWSSQYPTIASVNSSGTVTGQRSGTTSITGQYSSYIYSDVLEYPPYGYVCVASPLSGSGSGGCAVGQPDHVKVVVDQEGYPAACPTTGVYVRQMQMQVVDIGGNAITTDVYIQEAFPKITTNTCGNGQPVPSSCALTGNPFGVGQFLDTMSVSGNFCGSGISQSSGCGFSLTATWAQCQPSGSNTLWTSPRVTQSNGVEVNGSWTTYNAGTQFH